MEKRSHIKSYFLAFLTVFLMIHSGCSDDFFDQPAGDRITPDQHYNNTIDAYISLQGAIIPLQDIMPRLIMLDGLRSDMMDITSNAGVNLIAINNQEFDPGNPFIDPSDLYKVIININEVLANLDKVAERDRTFDDFIQFYATGNIIGMRAWAYLTLVRMYNKVFYLDGNMTELPAGLPGTEMSKNEIIDTLINQILPYIHDPDAETEFAELRIEHYINNKALLGELYLEINDYPNAAKYLKMACESYGDGSALLKVDQTYLDYGWRTIHLNAETAGLENISVIPYSSVEDQFNLLAGWFGHNYEYLVKPSDILVDSFMAQIPAAGAPGDPWRGLGVTFGRDTTAWLTDTTFEFESYITKYEIDNLDPFSSDIIISRAADIHLMLAEALNRMGDATSQKYALMLLNAGVNKESPKPPEYTAWRNNRGIRGRVYLNARVVSDALPANEKMLLIEDLIMAERAMELAFEGKRWSDLVRVASRRGQPEYLADKVAEKFKDDPAKYSEIRNKLLNSANWYLPLEY